MLEHVSSFCYLGVILEDSGKHEIELNDRVEEANNVYCAMRRRFINRMEVSQHTEMKVRI